MTEPIPPALTKPPSRGPAVEQEAERRTPWLLTTKEVAEITRLAPETLRYWRWKGMGPKSFRLGSRVVYRESDVTAWIEEQARV
jgi:predicted DNA-binding transcriptional regulator AlpA